VRPATPDDVASILQLIIELAEYEHARHEVKATEELLHKWLFEESLVHCLIAELNGETKGMALYFLNFSTWEAKPGIYIEDIVVSQSARGKGLGTALFCELARIAAKNDYPRIEWACLDWNAPSLGYYRSIGAKARKDWIPHRLESNAIARLAYGEDRALINR
jgi:GNAT superfamily N-acetyltransferase